MIADGTRCRRASLIQRIALTICIGLCVPAHAGEPAPLVLETSIPLGAVNGRIDHLAIDIARRRLYVAELGNNSVAVIDLDSRKILRTITGFDEPQGIAYMAAMDQIYVANGGDGSVRILNGADWSSAGQIMLGGDADNVRVDPAGRYVAVGYGSGALALIDPASRKKIADIPLHGHPESFQLTGDGQRAYVNVPGSHEIAVVDLVAHRQTAAWSTGALLANFPMAIGDEEKLLWVAFRIPARLTAFDASTGKATTTLDTCGDSDDVFIDKARLRTYIICGSGQIEVREQRGNRMTRITTSEGARTGLFAPDLDLLYVAVRATSSTPAAIWIYKPSPAVH